MKCLTTCRQPTAIAISIPVVITSKEQTIYADNERIELAVVDGVQTVYTFWVMKWQKWIGDDSSWR